MALVMARGPNIGTLYTFRATTDKTNEATIAKEGNSIDLWHKLFGHMSKKGLKIRVDKNMIPSTKSYDLSLCEHCLYGRQQRVSFLRGGHE